MYTARSWDVAEAPKNTTATLSTARTLTTMTTSLMSFHITSDTEGFPTAIVGAFKRLFSGVGITMDSQTRWPRERFAACLTYVAVSRLDCDRGCGGGRDIVMVLPRITILDWGAFMRVRQCWGNCFGGVRCLIIRWQRSLIKHHRRSRLIGWRWI